MDLIYASLDAFTYNLHVWVTGDEEQKEEKCTVSEHEALRADGLII